MGWACNTYKGEESCKKDFGGRKGPLRRPKHRREDITKMDIQNVGLVNALMNLWVP